MAKKSAIPGVSKPYSEMTGLGKVTFISATIGTILTAVIAMHQVYSYCIDRIDDHSVRIVVSSPIVNKHFLTLVNTNNNDLEVFKRKVEQRRLEDNIRGLRLDMKLIATHMNILYTISEMRPLTPSETEKLEELKSDRENIKIQLKNN